MTSSASASRTSSRRDLLVEAGAAQPLDDLAGDAGPHVAGDQQLFEFFERGGVEPAAGEDRVDALVEPVRAARQAGAQTAEPAARLGNLRRGFGRGGRGRRRVEEGPGWRSRFRRDDRLRSGRVESGGRRFRGVRFVGLRCRQIGFGRLGFGGLGFDRLLSGNTFARAATPPAEPVARGFGVRGGGGRRCRLRFRFAWGMNRFLFGGGR